MIQKLIPTRNLEVRIIAEKGFTGGSVKIVRDLAINAIVKRLAPPSLDTCELKIKNMVQEDVNVLTTINYDPSKLLKNSVELWGGESGVFIKIFNGDIIRGSNTFGGGDSIFTAACQTNYFNSVKQIAPISIKGRSDVTVLIAQLCKEAGLVFINQGVKGIFINDPILQGSSINQIMSLCEITDIGLIMSDNDVKIFPKTAIGKGPSRVLINASNGLIEYPYLDELGVNFKVKFNRNLLVGDIITLESTNDKCNGDWTIFENSLYLSNKDVQWEMQVRARRGYLR